MYSYLAQFNKFDPILLINSLHLIHLLPPLPVSLSLFPSPCPALAVCLSVGYLVIPAGSCLNIYAVRAVMKANAITFFSAASTLAPTAPSAAPNCCPKLLSAPAICPCCPSSRFNCPIVLAVIIQLARKRSHEANCLQKRN